MNDHSQIHEVLQAYFDGLFRGDAAQLRAVFHPQAALFGEVKGAPFFKPLEEYLAAVAGRQSPQARGETLQMQVLNVERSGPIARAKLHCPMLGFNYVDYLSLVRTGSRWLVVNKTFTHWEDSACPM